MQNQTSKKEGAYASLTGFKRAVPIILVALAVFTGLCFIMQDTGALGRAISKLLLGLFSIGGYFIPAFLVVHAIFYPSDVQKKTTLGRVIFTVITVCTISAFAHTLSNIGADKLTFSAKGSYVDGTNSEGGGFIGALIAFVLTKLFGNVGLIIIAILLFALYITYFLAGGKSVFSRILLKILDKISDFFGSFGERAKNGKVKKNEKREKKRREELADIQEALTDDDFFETDNGMKELTISELGIKEIRDDKDIENNPHLQEKVFHKSAVDSDEPRRTMDYGESYAPPATDKRRINMDYSTTGSVHDLSVSVEDSKFSPRVDDIIYDKNEAEKSADEVFDSSFNSFDVRMNEELSNKPSSKAVKAEAEKNIGIDELATASISDITEEDIERARQRADFEMKKRAAIDAQRRYAEAQEALARENARREFERREAMERERAAERAYAAEAQPAPAYEEVKVEEPKSAYIPEYMKKEEPVIEEKEPVREEPTASADAYRRAASFASAINDYERERATATTFKPYTPEIKEEITPEHREEEIRINRAMLDPTPRETEETVELDFSVDGEEESASDSKLEFDFSTEGDDDDAAREILGAISEDSDEDEDEEDISGESYGVYYGDENEDDAAEDEEIPPEEQNPDVIAQRNMFSFLREETKEETNEAEDDEEVDFPERPNIADSETVEDEAEDEEDDDPPFDYQPPKSSLFAEKMLRMTEKPASKVEAEDDDDYEPERPDYSDYQFPPIDLLIKGKAEEDIHQEEEKNQNAEKLVDALQQFNVRISIKGVDRGPRITRYEIVPARGVKVNAVTNLFNDIQLNLGVEGMRMEAPIPGKSAIGVEIPNKHPSTVYLRDIVEESEFISSPSKTLSCLGKDVTGNPVFADIAKMPHVLVAGATGMGKSVCINAILISILYKARPDEVKLIMIDPKKVEFTGYNGIPHLLIPVVTDVKQAAGALMWAVEQMEKRYDLMEKLEVRKLDAYNDKVRENPSLGEPLPKIIIVIDELNDIMIQVRKPVEGLIMSISQKARAAGIHLIIGTQRPSVDVITGVIKANIPSRIACKVASTVDSRTILEQSGAEKLLNNGDMLYIPAGAPKALRVQGAFVSDGEVSAVMKHLKAQAKGAVYDEKALEEINRAAQKCTKGKGGDDFDDDDDGDGDDSVGLLNDQQFLDSVDIAIRSNKISTSLLQRKLSIGYSKAAKYIDGMQELGIVSEPNGSKPREVLVSSDEWHEMLSRRSLD